jgi:uncharacterized protein YbgA (DUF1722 family)
MSSSNNEFRHDVHYPLCSYHSTLKSTKTNRIMLRCDNRKVLIFANGHLSQQQKALHNVIADQKHYNNNDFIYRYRRDICNCTRLSLGMIGLTTMKIIYIIFPMSK